MLDFGNDLPAAIGMAREAAEHLVKLEPENLNAAAAGPTLVIRVWLLNLTVPGMGHAVFIRGCLPKLLADFVTSGNLRGLDTTCVNAIQPESFFLNFSGANP